MKRLILHNRWKSAARLFGFSFSVFLICGCASLSPKSADTLFSSYKTLKEENLQVLIVRPLGGAMASLTAWEFNKDHWRRPFDPMPAMVGRNGIAAPDEKREGDGKTPSGTFPINRAFGYAPDLDIKLSYQQATENDFWVDDARSAQYNQWVVGKPQAVSFEEMKRKDELYELGAVIEYNTDPIVPGHGSAIFLHVWKGDGLPTSGCVALSKEHVRQLLSWLDASHAPVIIIQSSRE